MQLPEHENRVCHRGRPKSKTVKGIKKNHEYYLGMLMDGYINDDICIDEGEKVNPQDLELTSLVKWLWESQLFCNKSNKPLSISSLNRLASEEWKKHEEVRHNKKHKNNPIDDTGKKGKNKK